MKYHHILEDLFGNETRIAICRALVRFPKKVWSARQLATFVGKSHVAVIQNIGVLAALGVADVGRYGTAQTIRLNRIGWAYNRILKHALIAESRALDDLIADLKGILTGEPVTFAALFGSIVAMKESIDSDIDLLLITKDQETVEEHIAEKRGVIRRTFGNELSPYFMSIDEFVRKQKTPFLNGIKDVHIAIVGEWP